MVLSSGTVLVVGGGPSGIAAAIASSRAGEQTILLERYNHLGGLWTGGLVLPLLSTHGINKHNKYEKVLFGNGDEIAQRLVDLGMCIDEVNPVVDTEVVKFIMDEMMKESGVKTVNHCWASNLISGNNIIEAVIIETKSGRVAIKPKTVIDCTGDGDIMHLAGEEYDQKECTHCKQYCEYGAVSYQKKAPFVTPVPVFDKEKCVGCAACKIVCPENAIQIS